MEQKIVRNTFLKFFLPTVAGSVMLSVISMTDLIIAGNFVGEIALTAISLALPVIIFVQIISALFGMGGAITLSIRMGEGNLEECSRIFTLSLISSFVISMVALILGLTFLEPLILLLGGNYGMIMEQAKQYIGMLFWGMPFLVLSPIMITYLRNDNEQGYAMVCVVTAGLGNIAFSVFFVTVLNWGIVGIAAGTVAAEFLSCLLAGCRLFHKKRMFHLVRTKADLQTYVSILKPGLALAVIFLSQILLTIVINHILCAYGGSEGVAVYAVMKYLINFMFALFDGVTGAIQPMLGIYYGEKEEKNIRYTVRYSFSAMLMIAVVMLAAMEGFGQQLCVLFHVESESLTSMTVYAMHVLGFYCLAAAVMTFMNAFYRCTGKENVSFHFSILDNLVFPISFVLLFAKVFGMGTEGVWIGLLTSGLSTMAVWFFYCIWRKQGFLLLDREAFQRPPEELHVIYPAQLENIPKLLSDVERYCETEEIGVKLEYYINLAIEELVVNVISMAQECMKSSYYVDVRITPMEDGSTQLRIRDNLIQFNPADVGESDALGGAEEVLNREAVGNGGVNELGISIVKKIAKEYSYRRTIGYNNFLVTI